MPAISCEAGFYARLKVHDGACEFVWLRFSSALLRRKSPEASQFLVPGLSPFLHRPATMFDWFWSRSSIIMSAMLVASLIRIFLYSGFSFSTTSNTLVDKSTVKSAVKLIYAAIFILKSFCPGLFRAAFSCAATFQVRLDGNTGVN